MINFSSKIVQEDQELVLFRGNEKPQLIKGHWIPNTFLFSFDGQYFLIDPGCTEQNLGLIGDYLRKKEVLDIHILNSHWHLDHTANNGTLLKLFSGSTWHHETAKKAIEKYDGFFAEMLQEVLRSVQVDSFLKRNKYSLLESAAIETALRFFPDLSISMIVDYFKKYYQPIDIGASHAKYFDKKIIQSFRGFNGWKWDESFWALETPGHSDDSISYFMPKQRWLFIGDLDYFLSPNSLEGSIRLLHSSLEKVSDFVDNEKIEYLGRGHYAPISGNKNILDHLKNHLLMQKEFFDEVFKILNEKTVWRYQDLVDRLQNSNSKTVQLVFRSNNPVGPTFLDHYLIVMLKEQNYRLVSQGQWKKL